MTEYEETMIALATHQSQMLMSIQLDIYELHKNLFARHTLNENIYSVFNDELVDNINKINAHWHPEGELS
jgi:hypothetical protein